MIPKSDETLNSDFEIIEQYSKTYGLHAEKESINGKKDSIEAVKQAIYKIINTERYQNIIYTWDYGIELADLFGEPLDYVIPELKKRITEALTQDDRIQSVEAFAFTMDKGKVHVTFTAHTSFGDVTAGREVTI